MCWNLFITCLNKPLFLNSKEAICCCSFHWFSFHSLCSWISCISHHLRAIFPNVVIYQNRVLFLFTTPLSVASQSRLLTLFSSEFLCIATSVVTSHIAPNPRAKIGGTYIKVMPTAFLIVNENWGIRATPFPKQTPVILNKFNWILSTLFFFFFFFVKIALI